MAEPEMKLQQQQQPQDLAKAKETLAPSVGPANNIFGANPPELSEDDLKSGAVQKFLRAEISRLSLEVQQLQPFRDKFHQRDKDASILESQLKPARANEIGSGVLMTVGGTVVGMSVSCPPGMSPAIPVVIGAVLIVGGVAMKVFFK